MPKPTDADFIRLYASAVELFKLAEPKARNVNLRARALSVELMDLCEKALGRLYRPDRVEFKDLLRADEKEEK